ncbi:hypothetical protein F53441_2869 [Fusarium austroafricanum]|uniref:BZIP domain-containing protein n=1 Tax=Fusarium austroafricanum TaxID=2364996 RepID=A0A8H4P0J9_9HYPO|nr:hypothetical protein F53441_2869 [Fusarium austroafricanum]
MEQSTATLSDQTYDLSAIGNLNAVTHLLWDQWYFAANGCDYQYELSETGDYIPRFVGDPTSNEWSEPLLSQHSSAPRQTSEFTTLEHSPSNAGCRPSSPSGQPQAKIRRVSYSMGNAVNPSQCNSTKSPQAEIAVQEIHPDNKEHGNANKSKSSNSENSSYLKKVRERNKRAANKVRVKKREIEKNLEATEKDLEEVNRKLTACAKGLAHEVHDLKMQLLQHVDCDCVLIQQYIDNEANRYIQDISGESSARKEPKTNG